MATIVPTETVKRCSTGFTGPAFAYEVDWLLIQNGDVCQTSSPDRIPWLDRTFQVEGTFGGATLTIEGSNDGGANWHTLSDPQGSPVSFSSAGIKQVLEVVERMRPSISGGSGSSLNVYGFFRRTFSVG